MGEVHPFDTYPVHAEKYAGLPQRVAVVGVLEAGTLSQPGPLELTGLALQGLLQVILHEVLLLRTVDVLPLLDAVIIRWMSGGVGGVCLCMRACGREREREYEWEDK